LDGLAYRGPPGEEPWPAHPSAGLQGAIEAQYPAIEAQYPARPHLVMRADGHLHEVATPERYSFSYDPGDGIELKIISAKSRSNESRYLYESGYLYDISCTPRLYKPEIVDNKDGKILRLIELKNTIQSVFVTSEQQFLPVDKNRIRIDVVPMNFVFKSDEKEYVTEFEYTKLYDTGHDKYVFSLSKRVKLNYVPLPLKRESLEAATNKAPQTTFDVAVATPVDQHVEDEEEDFP